MATLATPDQAKCSDEELQTISNPSSPRFAPKTSELSVPSELSEAQLRLESLSQVPDCPDSPESRQARDVLATIEQCQEEQELGTREVSSDSPPEGVAASVDDESIREGSSALPPEGSAASVDEDGGTRSAHSSAAPPVRDCEFSISIPSSATPHIGSDDCCERDSSKTTSKNDVKREDEEDSMPEMVVRPSAYSDDSNAAQDFKAVHSMGSAQRSCVSAPSTSEMGTHLQRLLTPGSLRSDLPLSRRTTMNSNNSSYSKMHSDTESTLDPEGQELEDVFQPRAIDFVGSEEAWFRWAPPKPTSREERLALRCLHRDYFAVHVSDTYFSRSAIVAEVKLIESMNANFIVHVTDEVGRKSMPTGEVGELHWHGQLIGYATLLQESMGTGASGASARNTFGFKTLAKTVRVVQLAIVKRTVLICHLHQEGNQHAVLRVPQRGQEPEEVRLRLHVCATDTMMYAPDTRLRLLRQSILMFNGSQGESRTRELVDEPVQDGSVEVQSELVECGREATVIRLNKAGLYEVRFDGEKADRLLAFDPQPHNHRLAVNYSFEVGSNLMVLRPTEVQCREKTSGATTSNTEGSSSGRRHSRRDSVFKLFFGAKDKNKNSQVRRFECDLWKEVVVVDCLDENRFEVATSDRTSSGEKSEEATSATSEVWILEPSVLRCSMLRLRLREFAAALHAYGKRLHERCSFVPDLLEARRRYRMSTDLAKPRIALAKKSLEPVHATSGCSSGRALTQETLAFAASPLSQGGAASEFTSEEEQAWARLLRVGEAPKNRHYGIHEVPCWLIVGHASSGKTILAQRLALEVLKANTEMIPVLIHVSEFVAVMKRVLHSRGNKDVPREELAHRKHEEVLDAFLQATYSKGTKGEQESSDILQMLRQARDVRRLVLIFDSLEHAGSMTRALENLLARLAYDGHRIVATSLKTEEMGHLSQLEDVFGVLQVQPLSQEQQRCLACQILDTESSNALLLSITDSSLEVITRLPIVFQMVLRVAARLGQDAIEKLVESTTQVNYLGNIQMVLAVYDVAVPLAFKVEAASEMQDLLSALALALQLRGKKNFLALNVEVLLKHVARDALLPVWASLQSELEAGECALLRVQKTSENVLIFSFANESIKQYLAARLAAERDDEDLDAQLETAFFDSDWHRFLLFYLPLRFRLGHPQNLLLQSKSIKGHKVGVLLGLLQCANTFQTVNFADAHMRSEDSAHIILALSGSPTLVSLTLSGNHLVGAGIKALAGMLSDDPPLTYLDLQRCDLLPQCAHRLADALKHNTRLKKLDLGENFMGEPGAWHVGRMLQVNSSLEDLDCRSNDVEMPSGRVFGRALQVNSHLKRLCLRYNYLDPEGSKRLLEGLLKNKRLEDLDLQGNGMCVETCSLLGLVIGHHHSLTNLNVSGCSLGDDGILRVATALPDGKLKVLGLAANFVTGSGAGALVEALSAKTSLEALDISINNIPENMQKEMLRVWGTREGLNISNQVDVGHHEDFPPFLIAEEGEEAEVADQALAGDSPWTSTGVMPSGGVPSGVPSDAPSEKLSDNVESPTEHGGDEELLE